MEVKIRVIYGAEVALYIGSLFIGRSLYWDWDGNLLERSRVLPFSGSGGPKGRASEARKEAKPTEERSELGVDQRLADEAGEGVDV